jgi:hypothetical protein
MHDLHSPTATPLVTPSNLRDQGARLRYIQQYAYAIPSESYTRMLWTGLKRKAAYLPG